MLLQKQQLVETLRSQLEGKRVGLPIRVKEELPGVTMEAVRATIKEEVIEVMEESEMVTEPQVFPQAEQMQQQQQQRMLAAAELEQERQQQQLVMQQNQRNLQQQAHQRKRKTQKQQHNQQKQVSTVFLRRDISLFEISHMITFTLSSSRVIKRTEKRNCF